MEFIFSNVFYFVIEKHVCFISLHNSYDYLTGVRNDESSTV